mmetsp:Transcript_51745/g.160480  ORF Transcript_51745/g.160480 Transcript_51745/m.160480 type:complete len:350 (-) Transcript_51745:85-1134(-)
MVFGKPLCIVLGFASVRSWALVSDESCLVQSQGGAALQHHVALGPGAPDLTKGSPAQMLASVRSAAKQLPFDISGLSGGDFSMDQMMDFGMEFLALLKNNTIADLMSEGGRNMTRGLLAYSEDLAGATRNLSAAVKAATSKAAVLGALQDFFLSQDQRFAGMAADLAVDPRRFVQALPAGGLLGNATKPMMQMMEGMTKEQVSAFVFSFMRPKTDKIFRNETAFCGNFRPLYSNMSAAADFMTTKAPAALEGLKAMLPQVVPMVEGFAPEAAPRVSRMLNETVAGMEEVVAAFSRTLPLTIGTLDEVSGDRLGCRLGRPDIHPSSAAPLAKVGFAGAVAAATVAWALAA